MPRARDKRFELPDNVTMVTTKGREYFYFQVGRNTKHEGPRIRLPDDPRKEEFWIEYRKAQGQATGVPIDTVEASVDEFVVYLNSTTSLTPGTKDQYLRGASIMKTAWGPLARGGLRPAHIQAMMQAMSKRPGAANNFLGAVRAYQRWAIVQGHIQIRLTEGVAPFPKDNGHKPWTPAQIQAAKEKLTGVIRRGVVFYMYTGMRGSDAVRLGWDDIDEGGLSYEARKTGRDVYCPIVPELAAEMATWTTESGPFLKQEEGRAKGKPYTRKLFSKHFAKAREDIPELTGATLHGLRCTAVIRLRRMGLTTSQIQDIVGMSMAMIERYCRFADKKASGKAALETYKKALFDEDCKTLQNSEVENEE